MTTIDKAIKALELARQLIENKQEQGLDDYTLLECLSDAADGLQLRQTEAEIEGGGMIWYFVCGECHTAIDSRDRYCRYCGRGIVWK